MGYRHRQPQRRGLTAAQQAAHEKAYAACDHTAEGRFAKGDVVADWDGRAWKVVTYGIAYHEDVTGRLYGVVPCTGPKGWKETRELREAIERVLRDGTHTPDSRGGKPDERRDRPAGQAVAAWRDGRAGSLASFPVITAYEGGVVGAVRPVYDDAPTAAWVHDPKLAARLGKLIAACPSPVLLREAVVNERRTRLKIEPTHPRYAAYASGRDARPEADGLNLPAGEHRRIKADLDAADAGKTGEAE